MVKHLTDVVKLEKERVLFLHLVQGEQWCSCQAEMPRGITETSPGNNRRIVFLFFFSKVIGRPFDNPKGRWRVDSGINVPIKIEMEAAQRKITQLKNELLKQGIRATIC